MSQKLLVTGANGKLGRVVSDLLVSRLGHDPQEIILTSRSAASLQDFADKGYVVREADFDRPETLEAAFAGADHLLLISVDAIGQRIRLHTNAIEAAERAGVKHITYTSMPAPDTSPVIFAHEHIGTERAIADCAIPAWTILRNNWYYENLSEFFGSVLQTGAWMTSSGPGKVAQIARKDLALAAAAAVSKGGDTKQTLTLNGPEALTVPEMAEQINKEIGTSLNVIDLDDAALQAQLESFGVPPEFVGMTVSFDHHNREGLSGGNPYDYEALTGQSPQTFANWLQENQAQLKALAGLQDR